MSEHAWLSEPDPELLPFLQKLSNPAPREPDHTVLRAGLNAALTEGTKKGCASRLPKDEDYTVTDHKVAVQDGEIVVRCVVPTPKSEKEAFPLLVWSHGGGWFAGNLDTEDHNLRVIAHEQRMTVLSVDYRLAPEYRHPTQVNDIYAALKWAANNAAGLLHADIKKGFIIGGASAGGHLTSLVSHRARDDPFFQEHRITGQIYHIPAFLHPDAEVPEKFKDRLLSFEQNKGAPIIPADVVRHDWGFLLGENSKCSPSSPEVSPLLNPDLTRLPPAVFQIAGLDPLRDEALLYCDLLKAAGVRTKATVYPGQAHAFSVIWPEFKQSQKWEADVRDGFQWLLSGAPNLE